MQWLATLFGALSRILLAAGSDPALQTHALAATMGGQAHAFGRLGARCSLTVCFSDYSVTHFSKSSN